MAGEKKWCKGLKKARRKDKKEEALFCEKKRREKGKKRNNKRRESYQLFVTMSVRGADSISDPS